VARTAADVDEPSTAEKRAVIWWFSDTRDAELEPVESSEIREILTEVGDRRWQPRHRWGELESDGIAV
jgi:hypothetical protein